MHDEWPFYCWCAVIWLVWAENSDQISVCVYESDDDFILERIKIELLAHGDIVEIRSLRDSPQL